MALLDTNSCIYFLQGSHPHLLRRMKDASDLGISSITLAELSVGRREPAQQEVNDRLLKGFLRFVKTHDFTSETAQRYGRLVREVGFRRHDFDRLIAAHALALGETLVTSNARHFADIPGLKVEDWTLPL